MQFLVGQEVQIEAPMPDEVLVLLLSLLGILLFLMTYLFILFIWVSWEGNARKAKWAKDGKPKMSVTLKSRRIIKKNILLQCHNRTTAGAAYVFDCTEEHSMINVTFSAETPLQRGGEDKRVAVWYPGFAGCKVDNETESDV